MNALLQGPLHPTQGVAPHLRTGAAAANLQRRDQGAMVPLGRAGNASGKTAGDRMPDLVPCLRRFRELGIYDATEALTKARAGVT
jgi:hypothetical protein